ncbi:MAG: chromosome segregation ATPase [Patiriisocius sp.]|jgi:chromosome segregation ATPase
MKKLILFTGLLMLILTSCSQEEIKRLEAERAASVVVAGDKNNQINHLLDELVYIGDNLQSIRERQGIYSTLTMDDNAEIEFSETPEDKVKSEIEMIDFLMTNNLDRIASLEKNLENSGSEVSQVRKLLANFKIEVKLKGEEIQSLKDEIVNMEGEYAQLMDEHMNSQIFVELQNKQLELKENELNEVYFVYGSKTELIENNIIQKKGGVLGLGAVNVLKEDFNKEYFTKVDLRQLDKIAVTGKQVEILTEHPSTTYNLLKDDNDIVNELMIKDKDEFWAGSNYLVMLTK